MACKTPFGSPCGGGTRWIRRSVGVESVIVNGVETWNRADGYVPGARAGVIATR